MVISGKKVGVSIVPLFITNELDFQMTAGVRSVAAVPRSLPEYEKYRLGRPMDYRRLEAVRVHQMADSVCN